jgi:2,3-bisphosphoglycerate-dependent phosphoglycerate mutase
LQAENLTLRTSPTHDTVQRQLLLVRHGLPDYRGRQRGDEPPGPPLSDVGKDQARQAAAVLKSYPAARIHTSPLTRAVQTAECIRALMFLPLQIESELKEWHRTESLYQVSERSARWLARWLAGPEASAIVVGHASPLLALMRSALYLPHFAWHRPQRPDVLQVGTCDRFEISMGSITLLEINAEQVTATMLFHPGPRVIDAVCRPVRRCLPRPVHGHGENAFMRRPNLLRFIGYRPRTSPAEEQRA